MMVFITGDGTPIKGFYYWDNDTMGWELIGEDDADWFQQGTSTSPNDITDNIYTQGRVSIGSNTSTLGTLDIISNTPGTANLYLNTTGVNVSFSHGIFNWLNIEAATTGNVVGLLNIMEANNSPIVTGIENNFETTNADTIYGLHNIFYDNIGSDRRHGVLNSWEGGDNINFGFSNVSDDLLPVEGLFIGLYNIIDTVGSDDSYGTYSTFSGTSTGNKYGNYIEIENTSPGTHYGIYSDVQSNAGYAGYFLGRTSFGNTTANRYILPSSDGTAGQVLSTDGNGQLNFTTKEDDADWYEEGTTTAPNSITDNIYTQGNVAIDGQAYISNKIGIGTGAENPDGFLEVRANNTTTQPNINVVDIGSSGARINFSNTTTTNGNTWTLFGDTNNTSSSSLFHLFHTTTGNILTARGDGDVGIKGTPDTDFHIFHGNSSAADGFKLQNSSDNTWWRFYISSSTDDLRLYNSNNGTTIMGAFNDATGAYTSTSDRRLKKDLKELHFSWNTFMQLNPLTYKYKKDDLPTDYIGMIAQDVEKIYPQLVTYQEKEDIYHMDYSATGVVAIKAVQELKNVVNALEEKIENLATENTKLKVQLSKYERIERRLIVLEKLNNKSIQITEVSNSKK